MTASVTPGFRVVFFDHVDLPPDKIDRETVVASLTFSADWWLHFEDEPPFTAAEIARSIWNMFTLLDRSSLTPQGRCFALVAENEPNPAKCTAGRWLPADELLIRASFDLLFEANTERDGEYYVCKPTLL